MSSVNDRPGHAHGPAGHDHGDHDHAHDHGAADGAAPVAAAAAPLSIPEIRRRLAGKGGRTYWRSLEEISEAPDFLDFLHREFPRQASELTDAVSRREFLQLAAASLALAGLSACSPRNPAEKLVPFVKAPEGLTAGKPLYYASAMVQDGTATGILVESHMGRPIKIEGNELHPASLGASSARMQASILTMYDPDRSQVILNVGEVRPWAGFTGAMAQALDAQKGSGGAGIRFLTGAMASPTAAAQIQAVLAAFPMARWHQWEPLHNDNAVAGSRLAFGEALDTHYDLSGARVILSLDADFLFEGPGHLRYIRDFTDGRRVRGGGHGAPAGGHGAAGDAHGDAAASHGAADAPAMTMNRLYVAESGFTNTGSRADHRLGVSPAIVESVAREAARQLGVAGIAPGAALSASESRWVAGLVADLRSHAGASAVIAGPSAGPAVHALAHAINTTLGNTGRTVFHTAPLAAPAGGTMTESLAALCADMQQNRVTLLVIVGGNPVFDAPADLGFAGLMDKVAMRVHFGLYENETSELCHWHIPEAHFLEAWSDARGHDGTLSFVQPLIAPLYEGRSVHEFLGAFTGESAKPGYDIVRDHWKAARPGTDFEAWWSKAVHDGLAEGSASAPVVPALRDLSALPAPAAAPAGPVVLFRGDPSIGDGRDANNGWLQELSKPLTRLTWENTAIVSPRLAQAMKLHNGDIVELSVGGAMVKAPAWILPGQPEQSVTVHVGYGRRRSGRVGTGVGFDAYALRTAAAPWWAGVSLKKTGKRTKLACTQDHHSMEGRHLIRFATLEEHRKNPHWVHEFGIHDPPRDFTMYPNYEYNGNAWGLAVDLSSCVGCNACVVACQAENNIPVVGKVQVERGREMAWLRIDRYFEGELDNPSLHFQPVMCQQCENAPCEGVCPVAATVHNHEGLNDMAYNRCVGTRYCSNNCPYKVRRFNFLAYLDEKTPSLKLMRNPDVTVRTRGVMEKCTYCVQRINAARIEARKENRPIRDGEIVTACQQACPAGAIVFGDINDPQSRVAKMKADPLNYGILTDLNTRPRTTYLAELKNPNPEVETA